MIYRKGEFVIVNKSGSYFDKKSGKVESVANLEEERPFLVSFYFDKTMMKERFEHYEIKYIEDYDLENEKKNYYFQASMYEMS